MQKNVLGLEDKRNTGSGIFAAHSEDGDSDTGSGASNPPNKTSARVYQVFLTHTIN
jgi:hypothetical protein